MSTVMTATGHHQRRAIDMLIFANPSLWPYHPFLVVSRPAGEGEPVEWGVLYDARGVSDTYGHACTVFQPQALPNTEADLLTGPRQVFDCFEELADAGWTVD